MAYPSAEQINMVMEFTDFKDEKMIAKALQMKNYNAEAVVGEYFESPDKFVSKYGHTWDESAFSSNRDGEQPTVTAVTNPSFVIHPADNQVLYGSDPGGYYGSGVPPSRPPSPSRAGSRSPLSRITDLTAGGYNNAPVSRQQEEADLQQAINESLSGVQSPQPIPGPPPLPPLQQESGITSSGYSNVQFGPANRPEYDPNEWAMVELKRHEADPEPSQRTRSDGIPVFLRCRAEENWKQHRVGGIMTVLHSIPAARNLMLRMGGDPSYGYGNDPEWWKGKQILPPEMQQNQDVAIAEGYGGRFLPPWTDEVHRLIAFLDSTERSYGTADILTDCRPDEVPDSGDRERDFFDAFLEGATRADGTSADRTLVACATVGSLEGDGPGTLQQFTILDSNLSKEVMSGVESLYDVFDATFFADMDPDAENARAVITEPSEVLAFRFLEPDGLEQSIEIPETFYLDRYLGTNYDKIKQVHLDLHTISAAFKKSTEMEESLTKWVHPNGTRTHDRRTIIRAALEECRTGINRIKNRAFWVEHQMNEHGPDDYYLPEHKGEPTLEMDELRIIQYYNAKIQIMEKNLSDMENTIKNTIIPERNALRQLNLEVRKLFKGPAPEQGWNPAHKYTLRGVVSEVNKIFVRKQEPNLMEIDGASPPTEQWIKLWVMGDNDNAVMSQAVTYDTVVSEGCGRGKTPILIYATDKAMAETPEPLSGPLKTFIKLDNRLFKQEITQAERYGNSREKKRSAAAGTASSESKRLNRTSSNDSMATNQASAGDIDDDMRDAHFEMDTDGYNHAAAAVGDSIVMNMGGGNHYDTQRQQGEELVDVSDDSPPRPWQKKNQESTDKFFAGKGSADDPIDLLSTTPPPSSSGPNTGRKIDFDEMTPDRKRAAVWGQSVDGGGEGGEVQPQPEMSERGNMSPLFTRPAEGGGINNSSQAMDTSGGEEVD